MLSPWKARYGSVSWKRNELALRPGDHLHHQGEGRKGIASCKGGDTRSQYNVEADLFSKLLSGEVHAGRV